MTALLNRELMRFGFQSLRTSRKFLYALVISLIPLLVGIILFVNDASTEHRDPAAYRPQFTAIAQTLILTATVPFVALLLAGGMLADEVEDRTLTYLLVRPIPRRVLYASKAAPVILTAAAMGGLQALLLGLCRLVAAFVFGADAQVPYSSDHYDAGTAAPTIASWLLVLQVLPMAIIAAALAAALFAALFGFVSLLTTRFHFLANLLIFVAWEVPFGHLGGAPSYLTITFWGTSILGSTDPTINGLTSSAANPFLAVAWMVAWVGAWCWAGMKWIPKRDFNITSAET
jgi:ABC-2 type transport system permease protein